jgi:A/G-specific adenine glycosylase
LHAAPAQCSLCPVRQLCVAFKEKRTEQLPNLGRRETATTRHFTAFVVDRAGKFLVRQRPAGVVNAHLWEFPNVETGNGKMNPQLAAKSMFEIEPARLKHLCTVKHSITRYRITLEAFRFTGTNSLKSAGGRWQTPAQMQALAFASAHRKILLRLV